MLSWLKCMLAIVMALCLEHKQPPDMVPMDLLTMHSNAIVHQQWRALHQSLLNSRMICSLKAAAALATLDRLSAKKSIYQHT